MGFWIFMFIMCMVIPSVMTGFGFAFMKKAPRSINCYFGYRTKMSMQNRDTWNFAHKFLGRIWFVAGLFLIPLSAVTLAALAGREMELVGLIGCIICILQCVVLAIPISATEKALKKNFNEKGKRKE